MLISGHSCFLTSWLDRSERWPGEMWKFQLAAALAAKGINGV